MSELPAVPSSDDEQSAPLPATTRSGDGQPPAVLYPPVQYVEEAPGHTDDLQKIVEFLRLFWKHKWIVLFSLAAGLVGGVVLSLYEVPTYRTNATLEIQPGGDAISIVGGDGTIGTESERLASRTIRERTSSKLSSKAVDGPRPSAPLSWLRRLVGLREPSKAIAWPDSVSMAADSVEIKTSKNSRIVGIQCESADPQAAAEYANTLAEQYIEQDQEERWKSYQATSEWLTRTQADLKSKVEISERELADFAKSTGLMFLNETENISETKLRALQAALAQAGADRIAKQSVYESSLSSPTESLPEVLDYGPMGQYQQQLADLRRQMADLSVSLTPEHPRVKRIQAQIKDLEATREKERGNIIKRISIDFEAAKKREGQLQHEFDVQSRVLSDQARQPIYYSILKRDVETNRRLYQTTLAKAKEVSLASAMRSSSARIVDRAKAPMSPRQPNVPLNLTLGSMAGLFFGWVVIIARTRTDLTIHDSRMLEAKLQLRELGVIPSAKTDPEVRTLTAHVKGTEGLELVTWERKHSIFTEAFRTVMTSILFSKVEGREPRVLLVTSSTPQEGKSTVVSNLAIVMAESGQRVLLIDGDLRLPRIHNIFQVANNFGLSDILGSATPLSEYDDRVLVQQTSVPGVHVLPAGPARTNLSRLLYSSRVRELVERFRDTYDIVLIDAPPVLGLADARILALAADAVILVVRAHKTPSTAASEAAAKLELDGRPILGTILNDWNPKVSGDRAYGSGYYNAYYYTENSK